MIGLMKKYLLILSAFLLLTIIYINYTSSNTSVDGRTKQVNFDLKSSNTLIDGLTKNLNVSKKVTKFTGTNKDKWIIVTSVNEPTEQIRKLASIKEFQLLVVGDTKTNQAWSYEGVIFLSIADQESLGLAIYPDIPFKSYTRKNIGK